MNRLVKAIPLFAFAAVASAACSSSSNPGATASNSDAGSSSGGGSSEGGSSGTIVGGSQLCYKPAADIISSDLGTLKTFTPPCDPGANAFAFSVSGEANAITGYPYPPYDLSSATLMVDGWNWQIDRYIVVIDKITLWSDPNLSASDQSMHGSEVAELDGPFVVDLHKGGPLDGKGGGGEEALAIGAILNQNKVAGSPAFDPSVTYAFGFSTVQATYNAINVNLTSDEQADFDYMVEKGASVYYHGTANWNGTQGGSYTGMVGTCSANATTNYDDGYQTCASASEDGGEEGDAGTSSCPSIYNFAQLPQSMTFQFAFPTPTNYVNCVNYSVSELAGMDVRGVQSSTSQSVINQVTVHMDHPFWESFEEDTPVHWDDIAAQYIGQTNPTAHLEDFVGVPFHPFTDHASTTMPWHWCESSDLYTPPGQGAMSFSTLNVPIDPTGTCTGTIGVDYTSPMDNCPAIRDYYDFIRYTQSTQGHLNSQGLCFIDRQYPAPGGGS